MSFPVGIPGIPSPDPRKAQQRSAETRTGGPRPAEPRSGGPRPAAPSQPSPAAAGQDDLIRKIPPLYMAGGVLLVLAMVVVWAFFTSGQEQPTLTRPAFEEAKSRWDAKGPKSYDLDLSFYTPGAPAEIKVEVRNGQPTKVTNNGVDVVQESQRQGWTIPGLFGQIAADLEQEAHLSPEMQRRRKREEKIEVRYDAALGYPAVYRRDVYNPPPAFRWEVTAFEPR